MNIEEIANELSSLAYRLDSMRNHQATAEGLKTTGVLREAAAILRTYPDTKRNDPLTLEELREMAWKQAPVWCNDTDGIHAGLLCIRDEWVTSERTPHIWLLDEEGHSSIYSIDSLLKCGARFYRCRPEEAFTKTTSPNISPN